MPEIEDRRKKPLPVRMLLWDGTNLAQVDDFTGSDNNASREGDELEVWNDQEHAWFAVPCGHYVVKGALGEFYPMSPAAYADTTEPVAVPEAVLRDQLAALADEIEAFDGSGLGWRVQIAARIRQLLEGQAGA